VKPVGDWFQQTAGSGSLVLALPVALIAGLVSFFSPCVIPLLPGYLSYATGISGADLAEGRHGRGRLLAGSTLFVLGFAVVFVALGAVTGQFGLWLAMHVRQLNIVLGVFVMLMGLAFIGFVPLLQREVRFHKVPAVGLVAAPFLGFLFGLGWTPCVGPTLGVIFSLSAQEATAARGALLSAVFAVGLGLPFIFAALAYRRALSAFAVVRRHQQWVTRVGGLMLILVGILLVTGAWDWVVQWLQLKLVNDFEVPV
jgi:cytochrome c-type biogenesis protein